MKSSNERQNYNETGQCHLMAGSWFGGEGADQALITTAATLAAEAKPAKAHVSSSKESQLERLQERQFKMVN